MIKFNSIQCIFLRKQQIDKWDQGLLLEQCLFVCLCLHIVVYGYRKHVLSSGG